MWTQNHLIIIINSLRITEDPGLPNTNIKISHQPFHESIAPKKLSSIKTIKTFKISRKLHKKNIETVFNTVDLVLMPLNVECV